MSGLTKFFNTATTSQKMAFAAFIFAGLVVVGVMISVATRPTFAPLFAGLQQEDAAKIVDKLRENKVPYRIAAGGSTVEVPNDSVYEMRLKLAEDGLPRGGNSGFELFDGNRVGMTQFTEHVNYVRALQGELQRTIAELDSVDSARVHLVIPEPKLYVEDETRPTASVVLKLAGSRGINKQQMGGIVHLVSAAVEGMSPGDVKVLDTSGKLLSAPLEMAGDLLGGGVVMARLQMTREFERETEQKVQTMLDQVAGPGKAIVRVNASLDFDSSETEQAIYEPAMDGKGVLESQTEMRENYRGTAPVTGGIPGVTSNSRPNIAQSQGSTTDGYERVETDTKYQVTKKIQKSSIAPGQINRLSVALFVDESIEASQMQSLENVASAAAGVDLQRGDQMVVERLPFAEVEVAEAATGGGSRARELYFSIGKDIAAIILLLIFLFFARSMFMSKSSAKSDEPYRDEYRRSPAPETSNYVAATAASQAQPAAAQSPRNGKPALNDMDPEKMALALRGLLTETEES